MAAKMIKVECWKCGGSGHIEAFSHIASGDCFTCKGSGFKMVREGKVKPVAPLNEWQQEQVDAITSGDLSVLSYKQLAELRSFAHWPLKQAPNLLEIWRDRGEPHFQRRQEEKLAAYYEANPV